MLFYNRCQTLVAISTDPKLLLSFYDDFDSITNVIISAKTCFIEKTFYYN